MRRIGRQQLVRIVALVGLLGLVARFGVLVSSTETGWAQLHWHWRDAATSLVAGEPLDFGMQDPADQAQQLLAHIDRLVARHPDDAQLMAGAALLLHRPDELFTLRFIEWGEKPTSRQDHSKYRHYVEFERLCHERCLALAQRATELAPQHDQWWQLRAVLLDSYIALRTPEWREILDECAQHDPTNALYDYLRLVMERQATMVIAPSTGGSQPRLMDLPTCAHIIATLEHGLQRERFHIGHEGILAATRVIELLPLRPSDQVSLASKTTEWDTWQGISSWIFQDLYSAAYEPLREQHPAEYMQLHRQFLELTQKAAPGSPFGLYAITAYHGGILRNLILAARANPSLTTPEELSQWSARRMEVEIKERVTAQARSAWYDWTGQSPRLPRQFRRPLVAAVLLEHVPSLILLGFLAAGAAHLVRKTLSSRSDSAMAETGYHRFAAWIWGGLATAVSYTMYGLAPAQLIPAHVEAWTWTLLAAAPAALIMLGVFCRAIYRKRGRFSLMALALVTTALGALVGNIALVIDGGILDQLPFAWHIPPASPTGWDARNYLYFTEEASEPWYVSWTQWRAWHGPAITLRLWVIGLAVWTYLQLYRSRVKQSVAAVDPPLPRTPSSSEVVPAPPALLAQRLGSDVLLVVHQVASLVIAPLGTLTLSCLIVYLSWAPALLADYDAWHALRMAPHRSTAPWESWPTLIDRVQFDPIKYSRIRAESLGEVQQELQQ